MHNNKIALIMKKFSLACGEELIRNRWFYSFLSFQFSNIILSISSVLTFSLFLNLSRVICEPVWQFCLLSVIIQREFPYFVYLEILVSDVCMYHWYLVATSWLILFAIAFYIFYSYFAKESNLHSLWYRDEMKDIDHR